MTSQSYPDAELEAGADEAAALASMRFVMSRCVRCSTVLLLSCVLAVFATGPAHAGAPQVWISSNDPTHGGAPDFWQMFAPNAPWQSAKQHVAVFGIDQNLVTNGPALCIRCTEEGVKPELHLLAMAVPVCLGIVCSTDAAAQDVVVVRAQPREIWLAPQGINHPALDFAALFQPDAPWKEAASHVNVFKLSTPFVLQATAEQLDAVVSDLNRRGIALALETGVMNVPHNPASGCGGMGNVEGYRTVEVAEQIARKLKAAHGELKYIVMSAPFFFGHFYTGRPPGNLGCHSTVLEIMALSKPTLSVYLREFPGIMIGEVEPTSYIDGEPGWQIDLQEWAAEFRAAMDKPLAFMQVNVQWDQPDAVQNASVFCKFAQQLQRQGLLGRLGIAYDGSVNETSDKAWTKAARNHVVLLEREYELRPDQAIFQSLQINPTHSMPDSAKDTLTSLVNFYFTPAVEALRGEK